MAGRTYFQILNEASVPSQFTAALAGFGTPDPDTGGVTGGVGQILRGMTPGFVIRTGLVSQTTHVEALPGRVFAVMDEAGANEFAVIHVGAPGATDVLVTYSSVEPKGVPTLQFNGSVTGYQVDKHELPVSFDELFDVTFV